MSHAVEQKTEHADPVRRVRVCTADDLACKKPKPDAACLVDVATKVLTASGGRDRVYVDSAKATRR